MNSETFGFTKFHSRQKFSQDANMVLTNTEISLSYNFFQTTKLTYSDSSRNFLQICWSSHCPKVSTTFRKSFSQLNTTSRIHAANQSIDKTHPNFPLKWYNYAINGHNFTEIGHFPLFLAPFLTYTH